MITPKRTPSQPEALMRRYNDLVRDALTGVVQGEDALQRFYGMMGYHLGWLDQDMAPMPARAGKYIRPVLCLLLAEGLGAAIEECVPLAAGIELLHNFSLVHDDIEDRSNTRRGRPTVWSIWGEAQAINAGDGLFSLAHVLWLRAPVAERDPLAFIAILRSLEHTIITLCEGQFLDMSGEGMLDQSSAAYMTMISKKTAALIGESAWVGARVATADQRVLDAARTFGYELGLAFQVRDDLLGIWGDEQETGKSASSDIATRKMTLPIILALEEGAPVLVRALRARYGSPPREADDEAQIRALLDETGAAQRTAEVERAHRLAAMHALERVPLDAAWREQVEAFARSFVGRRA